jgi:hypothetical protein
LAAVLIGAKMKAIPATWAQRRNTRTPGETSRFKSDIQ